MSLKYFAPICILLLLPMGCAVMNENECVTADWHMVGLEEGLKGKSAVTIGSYRQACAEYGITPNLSAYQAGHLQGIKQFCSPQKAFQLGASGQHLPLVCPTNIHPNYLKRHNKGLRKYCTVSTVYKLGKKGSDFPQICPQDLTERLTFSYQDGHKIFEKIRGYRSEIDTIRGELTGINRHIDELEVEREGHEKGVKQARAGILNNKTTNLQKVIFYTEKDRLESLIKTLDDELWDLHNHKSQHQSTIKAIKNDISFANKRPIRYLAK